MYSVDARPVTQSVSEWREACITPRHNNDGVSNTRTTPAKTQPSRRQPESRGLKYPIWIRDQLQVYLPGIRDYLFIGDEHGVLL